MNTAVIINQNPIKLMPCFFRKNLPEPNHFLLNYWNTVTIFKRIYTGKVIFNLSSENNWLMRNFVSFTDSQISYKSYFVLNYWTEPKYRKTNRILFETGYFVSSVNFYRVIYNCLFIIEKK